MCLSEYLDQTTRMPASFYTEYKNYVQGRYQLIFSGVRGKMIVTCTISGGGKMM